MAFCSKCGTQVNDGVNNCPKCGAAVGSSSQTDYAAKIASLNNTSDFTTEFDPADIGQNKVMAVLAYLSWLVLIPIFAAPNSKFARFHANQGLLLFIVEAIMGVVYGVITAITVWVLPVFLIFTALIGLVGILFLVLMILGIINAASGRAKELPVIGKYRILK